jgi:cyclophilin family peptidyl-prolyl cis-trans isomerase
MSLPLEKTKLGGVTAAVAVLLLVSAPLRGVADTGIAPITPCDAPKLTLTTTAGALAVELYRDAAPNTVDRILRWARDYDNAGSELTFDWVRPHAEIRTTPLDLGIAKVPLELDALALGLDRARITTLGAAMELIQGEFWTIHAAHKASPPTQQFGRWLEQWRSTRSAEFLVNVTRQEILEAFGFNFQAGLASRPVTKGSVLLRNIGTDAAESRLTFILGDRPKETGKWLVIGHVVNGLELVRNISIQPLASEFAKRGVPDKPVVLRAVELSCSAQ